jgi:hypothetical protein
MGQALNQAESRQRSGNNLLSPSDVIVVSVVFPVSRATSRQKVEENGLQDAVVAGPFYPVTRDVTITDLVPNTYTPASKCEAKQKRCLCVKVLLPHHQAHDSSFLLLSSRTAAAVC